MKKKTKLLIRDAFLATILSSSLIFLLSITIISISFFNPIQKALTDFNFLDVYYAQEFGDSNTINTDIVLVNVEHKNRFEIAQLIERVLEEEPKVIGVDIIFKDKKEAFSDSILASVLNHQKIVSSYIITDSITIENHPLFNSNANGFVNFNFDDRSNVIREFVGIRTINGLDELSFSTQVAQLYIGDTWQNYNYDKMLRNLNPVKYHGNYDKFLTLDFDDFLYNQEKVILKDKIVLFGYIGTPIGNQYDVEDKYFTPVNKITSGKSLPDMHGIVVHANILNMLINKDFFLKVSLFWIGIITILCMYFSSIYFIKTDRKYKITYRTRKNIYLLIFSVFVMVLAFWLFRKGIIIKTFPIIVGTILAGSYYKYFKHLTRFIKSKRKWKSYIK